MAGFNRGRGYMPEYDESLESTERNISPSSRAHHHPTVAYYRPRGYIAPRSGIPQPIDVYNDEEGEEEEEVHGGQTSGDSNDNPLYEVEDEVSRFPQSLTSRQGSPNNNPLYGNDFFRPMAASSISMTEFLKPKGRGSPHSSDYSSSARPKRPDRFDNVRNIMAESSDDEEASSSRRVLPQSRPPQQNVGLGLFRSPRVDQTMLRYPPARFSPVFPAAPAASKQLASNHKGKRTKGLRQSPPMQLNIGDLIAAVRSDKNLLLGEVRKHGNREPRVPGDHDRFFAPRKGDIIIHFAPSPEDNNLLEYYDEKKSLPRLEPGDKLVRVKYDNYKLPDHLMITSKLYLYAPEWVYLGKALQTIKTV